MLPPPPVAPPPIATASSDEARLIAAARGAITRGDLRAAILLLDDHSRRFAAGELVEERLVLRIEVAVRGGDTPSLGRHIAAYRASFPNGFLRDRVDRLDPTLPTPATGVPR